MEPRQDVDHRDVDAVVLPIDVKVVLDQPLCIINVLGLEYLTGLFDHAGDILTHGQRSRRQGFQRFIEGSKRVFLGHLTLPIRRASKAEDGAGSTKAAGDIGFGPFILRCLEYLIGFSVLDQLAEVHKPGAG